MNNSLKCCANCLNQQHIKDGNDALDENVCIIKNSGCCYEDNCHMSLINNNFIFDKKIKYLNNTPYILQNQWNQFRWDDIDYITYIYIYTNQSKDIQTKNNSIILLPKSDKNDNRWYKLCFENTGNIYFRGWKDKGCVGSIENKITIQYNENKDNLCLLDNNIKIIDKCNLNRANMINGECQCISSYINPPLCDKEIFWKTFGIVMTSISICIIIINLCYIIYKRFKKKSQPPITNIYLNQN